MIKIEALSKSFEKESVLSEVKLNVRQGSIYGLLGSNGAGKTTLLKIIAGIIKADKGNVLIAGSEVFEQVSSKQRLIFIPDRSFFFQHYTIKQMADFYKEQYPTFSERRFLELKDVFNLDMKKKVHQFSKGMQRQVTLWLSLAAQPDVLILDEPFDGLDAVVRKKIKNLIVSDVAEREMTVMISSHNLREVEDLCDAVGILHKGEFVTQRDLDDLKSDVHKVQVAFRETKPQLFSDFTVLHKEKRGSVHLYIVKGNLMDIESHLAANNPLLSDILPLTLEEIFIYEMEGIGYAMEHILE